MFQWQWKGGETLLCEQWRVWRRQVCSLSSVSHLLNPDYDSFAEDPDEAGM